MNKTNKQSINQSINQSLPPQLPLEHQLITETKWLSNEQIVGFLKTTATTTTTKKTNEFLLFRRVIQFYRACKQETLP